MKTDKVTLPAYLASALINGDLSGLERSDLPLYHAAIEYAAPGYYVDVSEDTHFAWRNDLNSVGGDVAEYTILYPDEG